MTEENTIKSDRNKLIEHPLTYGEVFVSFDRVINNEQTPDSIKDSLINIRQSIASITKIRIQERAVELTKLGNSELEKYKIECEAMRINQERMEGVLFKLIDKLIYE